MAKKKVNAPTEPVCPFLGQGCLKHGCALYSHIQGTNPQTNQPVDAWDCTFKLLPLLLVDNIRHLNGIQASTESTRNEMVKAANVMIASSFNRREPLIFDDQPLLPGE